VRHLHFFGIFSLDTGLSGNPYKTSLPLRNNLFSGAKKEPSCRGRIIISQTPRAVKHFFYEYLIFLSELWFITTYIIYIVLLWKAVCSKNPWTRYVCLSIITIGAFIGWQGVKNSI
jgi:hypothetical protein